MNFKGAICFLFFGFLGAQSAFSADFSIDQEFKARKLSEAFSKKYGMKIKLKREDGKLIVKFWDKGFFKKNWKLTDQGAAFIRTLTKNLCLDEKNCEVLLKSHHVEGKSVNDSKLALVKSQYKLVSVSWHLLNSRVLPEDLTQMSLGDREPMMDPTQGSDIKKFDMKEMNTRTEIAFMNKQKEMK